MDVKIIDAIARIFTVAYTFFYEPEVKDLTYQINKIKKLKDKVQSQIDASHKKLIENHVHVWLKDAEDINIRADELLSREKPSWTCLGVLHIPKPVPRVLLGRGAARLAKDIAQLIVSGGKILDSNFANKEPMEKRLHSKIAQYSSDELDTTYHKFGSRQQDYAKLWAALVKEDGDSIVGICGRPGVGKTWMMEQAYKECKEKKIFDHFTRAYVGTEADAIKLQDQLASYLNYHFESKDDQMDRAYELKQCLMNGGKTLVLLDDIWDVISLTKIGVPFADGSFKGCKILLTSQSHYVCLGNNCKDPIEIKKLEHEEAREMFRNTVGTSNFNSVGDKLADNVCTSCAGLPLLIRAVGSSLKFAPKSSWEDALYKIEYGRFGWIDGIEPQVYASLKMCLEKLEDASKKCLLLCSLFPGDADIEIKMLFDLATWSEMLDSKKDVRVYIDTLKSSYLLLQGNDEYTIRMPDTVRDVARSIATRDPDYAFSYIECSSWLPDNVDYSTRRLLHIDLQGDYVGFPYDLVCLNLGILWLQCNNHPQELTGGLFTNLRLLVIKDMVFSDEKCSSNPMEELSLLILYSCYLHKSSLSFLNFTACNLEALSIRQCDLPEHHDIQPPNVFKNLIIVEIIECTGSKFLFPVAVVNCLVQMQELSVEGCYGMEEIVRVGSTDTEIICFPNLKSLMLDDLPRLTHFYSDKPGGISSSVEIVEITDNTASSSTPFFFEKVAFPSLEKLIIKKIGDVTEIWGYKATELHKLEKLRELTISSCPSLNNIFHHSVATDFVNLEKMHVTSCDSMSEIIGEGGEEDGLMFPALTELYLGDLSSLKTFSCKVLEVDHVGPCTLFSRLVFRSFRKLANLTISDCILLEKIVEDEDHTTAEMSVSLPELQSVSLHGLPNLRNRGIPSWNMPELKVVKVDHCGLSTLFTSYAFKNLKQLQKLDVTNCSSLEKIVEDESVNSETPRSRERTSLVVLNENPFHLPRLKSFIHNSSQAFDLPALENVSLYGCSSMKKFASFQIKVPPVDIYDGHRLNKNISDLNSYVAQHVDGKEYTGDGDSSSKVEADDNINDGADDEESSVAKTIRGTRRRRGIHKDESTSYSRELVTESKEDEDEKQRKLTKHEN